MKHLLWCTLELPRRDIIIIISLHRDNCTLYRISTCGGSRKSHLGTTLIWSQHMTRTFSCGDYSNKMSSCVITENCCLQWKKKEEESPSVTKQVHLPSSRSKFFSFFFFFFFFFCLKKRYHLILEKDSYNRLFMVAFIQQTCRNPFGMYSTHPFTSFLWSPSFLAHLSRRLKVSHCDHSLSVVVVVRMSVRPQYLNNIS